MERKLFKYDFDGLFFSPISAVLVYTYNMIFLLGGGGVVYSGDYLIVLSKFGK